jgi:D-alanyl-D-alanine carboxypeptidase
MKKLFFETFIFLVISANFALAGELKFGHMQYMEAKKHELVAVGAYPDGKKMYLQKDAYDNYLELRALAQKAGVKLKMIYGFRSKTYQKYLFKRAIKRYGTIEKAAKVVAPPGYSQHHTGFAVDLGDLDSPQSDLKASFAETKAYAWLTSHARSFGFYLSFPENNAQNISFEPWHWYYKEIDDKGKSEK